MKCPDVRFQVESIPSPNNCQTDPITNSFSHPVMKIHSVNYSTTNLVRIVPFLTDNEKLSNGVVDDGSTLSFISQSLRQNLSHLKSRTVRCEVTGINNSSQQIINEEVTVPIFSTTHSAKFLVEAIVVEQINSGISLPNMIELERRFPELKKIDFPKLADEPVQFLFGENCWRRWTHG